MHSMHCIKPRHIYGKYQISISNIFHILKYLLRDKDRDACPSNGCCYFKKEKAGCPSNCAQHTKAGCFLICPFLFAQAGWWFTGCWTALLTAGYGNANGNGTTLTSSDGSTRPEAIAVTLPYPSIVWRDPSTWGQFDAVKFTLKLK